jgi:hypothetical protein
MMEAISSFQTSVLVKATGSDIPEDGNLHAEDVLRLHKFIYVKSDVRSGWIAVPIGWSGYKV